jgi:type IV secretory pathway TrbD component
VAKADPYGDVYREPTAAEKRLYNLIEDADGCRGKYAISGLSTPKIHHGEGQTKLIIVMGMLAASCALLLYRFYLGNFGLSTAWVLVPMVVIIASFPPLVRDYRRANNIRRLIRRAQAENRAIFRTDKELYEAADILGDDFTLFPLAKIFRKRLLIFNTKAGFVKFALRDK